MSERWIEFADGVFARRYDELDQTIGLVVGEERCLVVDAGPDQVRGAELAAEIRTITPLEWTVLITHAHWDHFFGTAAFLPCPVLAHRRCRDQMAADAEHQRDTRVCWYRDQGRPSNARQLASAPLVAPTDVLDERLELDLGGRTVELVHPGRGHTAGDVIVRAGDVVFAGDLVEQGAPPAIGDDAYPMEWPSTMDRLLALAPTVVVPGHGEPVDTDFVVRQQHDLAIIGSLFHAVHTGQLAVKDAVAQSPYPDDHTRPVFQRAAGIDNDS